MNVVSLQNLVDDLAERAQLLRQDLTALDKEMLVGLLNRAVRWLWSATSAQMLPGQALFDSVTLDVDGCIPAVDVDGATFWSVWSEDPRAVRPELRARLLKHAVDKGDGRIQVVGGLEDEVVVLVKKGRLPRWTSTPALSTDYSTESVEYRPKSYAFWCLFPLGAPNAGPDGVIPAGHYYVALDDDVRIENVGNAAQWRRVDLAEELAEVVVVRANYERMASGTEVPEAAGRDLAYCVDLLDEAFLAAQLQPGLKPWLYNYNH